MIKSKVVYHPGYQKFTEYDSEGNVVKSGSFRIPEKVEDILVNEQATIVWLNDGSKGVAICGPGDTFNQTTGRKIAYLRAKIVSLQNEIKNTIKQTYKK